MGKFPAFSTVLQEQSFKFIIDNISLCWKTLRKSLHNIGQKWLNRSDLKFYI